MNKVSSRVQLRWRVSDSRVFSDEQKAAIRAFAAGRLNKEDEIVLAAESERSQLQNREEVVRRLQDLVRLALTPRKKRKPTKVSRSQKRKRLDEKRLVGERKRSRKSPRGEW